MSVIWGFLMSKAGACVLLALLLVVLAGGAYTYVSKSAQIKSLTTQLTVEKECRVGTVCATRQEGIANAHKEEVKLIQAEAADALKKQAADLQARADAAAATLQKQIVVLNQSNVDWQHRYQEALKQPACADWAKEIVACPVQ